MPVRRVDIHCHCLPGVDDGPRTTDDAVALCRALVNDGFTDAVATPHQLGRYDGYNAAPQVRQAVAQLQAALDAHKVVLRLHPGGEVRVDERLARMIADDRVLTLADGKKYLLLELATSAYIDPGSLVAHLAPSGLKVVLAHPERYAALQRDHDSAWAWIEHGGALQVNADALLGGAGSAAQMAAWDWVQRGWVALVATDSHGPGIRMPRMTDAIELITRKLGHTMARRVCVENPVRVLEGQDLSRVEASEL
jgi:protein-tyrosine phosphatase